MTALASLPRRYAADLHLHSRYAQAVSKHMTLETMALMARRKGMDVLGTGDCLQPQWLRELEEKLLPAEPGWFALNPEIDRAVLETIPAHLRRPMRFVLSTEVHCNPPGNGELQGIHHLLYFPDFTQANKFRVKLNPYGDLNEGRPTVRITSSQLLELAKEHAPQCHFAPAHVMNPYFSSLGSQEGSATLEENFGAYTSQLLAAELGLTSIPPMCRRIASLDAHALFANSDAHSPENIGRECTLLETAPGYDAMFSAIHGGSREAVIGCLKSSIHRTRYFLNWCGRCKIAYDAEICPHGHGRLITGSRDWLERIATRPTPASLPKTPRFRMYLALRQLIGEFRGISPASKTVEGIYDQLLRHVGHERFILSQASLEQLTQATAPSLAEAIIFQRQVPHHTPISIPKDTVQMDLL